MSWKNALKRGAEFAGTGALAGVPGGWAGAGIGAGVGGLAGLISGAFEKDQPETNFNSADGQMSDMDGFQKWLFGTPEGQQAFSRFSPEQRQALGEALRSGRDRINNPSKGFEPIRQNAIDTFNKRTVPELAHMFSASGSNAPSSGTLLSQLSGAGSDLSSNLAAQESLYGQENIGLGLKELGLGLSPQYDQGIQQGAGGPNRASRFIDLGIDFAKDAYNSYLGSKGKAVPAGTAAPTLAKNELMTGNQALRQAVSPYTTVPLLQRSYNA